ncbi:MAG: hypothetical protein HC852_15720 [Acaryochloridaceae cyanobacterium RU_4_10]|nr:hypothetical protein [Acaryochloridaceae cyanobacterium RU_4_10]
MVPIPKHQAAYYSDRVDRGDCLVTVEGTDAEIRQAEQILSKWDIQEWSVLLLLLVKTLENYHCP